MSYTSFKSVRTCNVEQGMSARHESDRFLSPNNAVCIPWNQQDLVGRSVCEDSFYTKRAGCHSALDRVGVENGLRPQYAEFITLDASGIEGNLNKATSHQRKQVIANTQKHTGNFGSSVSSSVMPTCGN